MDITQKKTAIIIAAGSGMGAATARKFAADGFHVGLLSKPSGAHVQKTVASAFGNT